MGITQKLLKMMNGTRNTDETHPYWGGNQRVIKSFLQDVIRDLVQSELIDLQVGSDDGAYASFWNVFCYKKNSTSTYTRGITLYLCELEPVVVMGSTGGKRGKNQSGLFDLRPENLNIFPQGDWTEVVIELKYKLEKHGFILLDPEFVKQPMPFEVKIRTILKQPPYQIFDAFFHSED